MVVMESEHTSNVTTSMATSDADDGPLMMMVMVIQVPFFF